MPKDFDSYWAELVQKNAGLSSSEKMTISVESFRAAMKRAYGQGRSDGLNLDGGGPGIVGNVFDSIFGGFNKKG